MKSLCPFHWTWSRNFIPKHVCYCVHVGALAPLITLLQRTDMTRLHVLMSTRFPTIRRSKDFECLSLAQFQESQTTVDHTLPMSICSIPIWRYRRAAPKKKKWKRQRYNNSTEYKQRQQTMRQNQRNLNNNTHSNAKNNIEVMFVSGQPQTVPSSRDVEISEA